MAAYHAGQAIPALEQTPVEHRRSPDPAFPA